MSPEEEQMPDAEPIEGESREDEAIPPPVEESEPKVTGTITEVTKKTEEEIREEKRVAAFAEIGRTAPPAPEAMTEPREADVPAPTNTVEECKRLRERVADLKTAIRPLAMLEVENSRSAEFTVCIRGASVITAGDVRIARTLFLRK